MAREVEHGKSKRGTSLKAERKELGVNTVRLRIEDGCIQVGSEQEERKGEERKMIREYKRLHCPEQCGRRLLRERH